MILSLCYYKSSNSAPDPHCIFYRCFRGFSSNRPKSALRRRTVDREEGDLDEEDDADSDEEFDHSAYEKFFMEGIAWAQGNHGNA